MPSSTCQTQPPPSGAGHRPHHPAAQPGQAEQRGDGQPEQQGDQRRRAQGGREGLGAVHLSAERPAVGSIGVRPPGGSGSGYQGVATAMTTTSAMPRTTAVDQRGATRRPRVLTGRLAARPRS